MLAGGIFRQENALRNANRAAESVGFLCGYRFNRLPAPSA